MYNPSRGGVRGGADQFTWESVKNDKHRENYLGHSLKAPVGRWQKGKDLSWYAKERKDADGEPDKSNQSELASIKRAEEEAMLIALGHNIVRKTQTLSKEDMREALKRNTGERDAHNIERIDGVGASSHRVALLSGVGKNSRQKSDGIEFEYHKERTTDVVAKTEKKDGSLHEERKKSKKKSKKHKKEKKHKKHHKKSYGSDLSDSSFKHKTKYDKSESDNDDGNSSKVKNHKKSKHRHKEYSSDETERRHYSDSNQKDHKRHKKQNSSIKKRRYDTSESD